MKKGPDRIELEKKQRRKNLKELKKQKNKKNRNRRLKGTTTTWTQKNFPSLDLSEKSKE